MAEKAEVRAEIDAELKEKAEGILKQLGISPSYAVGDALQRDCARERYAAGAITFPEAD